MLETSDIELMEQSFPFWPELTLDQLNTLCTNATLNVQAKNTLLHRGEHDCLGVLLIKKGQLRTYMLSEDGKEITLFRLGPGNICILSASCVLNEITFDVYISAEEDCEYIQINSRLFSLLSEENIHVEAYSYRLIAEQFSDVMWAMQQILFMKMDQRLAIFLYDEMTAKNTDTISLTHDQIAKYMGSAREVVSRMLKYFSEEGIVSVSRGGIKILDRKKLRSLC